MTYEDEIAPLSELLEYLESYLQEEPDNLTTMMAHLLFDKVKIIVLEAQKLKENKS
ncbi:hypothetical protein R6Y90_19695 [Alteromonas macleodii]|uniref:hypothetical protein n=1 Tax=Alteromonas macleodii TaxID=28108 RepID=UPI002981BF54|nr:hypothetical protein [Alteromonas macleodii]MDW5287165.1 hypothetical protein [Alteromonas macleodii]